MNIRDIAKLCGVSASTVSKVLHDDKTISEETRKKVLNVVKEYNYVPYSEVLKNAAPRMDMIAVVLDEEQSFYKELLYGIEDSAFDYGYNIVVCNIAEGEERRRKYLQVLENKGINGMIFLGRKEGNACKLPTVEVGGRIFPAHEEKLSQICFDPEEMGYLGVKYLLGQGHREIACFVKPGEDGIKAGYRKAYEEIFTQPREEWVFELEENLTEDMIGNCVGLGVTAVFCSDVGYGNMIYAGLLKCNISVPAEMMPKKLEDARHVRGKRRSGGALASAGHDGGNFRRPDCEKGHGGPRRDDGTQGAGVAVPRAGGTGDFREGERGEPVGKRAGRKDCRDRKHEYGL